MDPISSIAHNSRCRTKNGKYIISGIVANTIKSLDEVKAEVDTFLYLANNTTPFASVHFEPSLDGEIVTEDEILVESYNLDHPEQSTLYRKLDGKVYKYSNPTGITITKLPISIDNLLIANMFNTLQTQIVVTQI